MALSTAVWVGESKKWIPELIERAKKLRVGPGWIQSRKFWFLVKVIRSHLKSRDCLSVGNDPKSDLGPLITPQAKERVCRLIESGKKEGAEVVLDGRDCVVPGYEKGNFVGAL